MANKLSILEVTIVTTDALKQLNDAAASSPFWQNESILDQRTETKPTRGKSDSSAAESHLKNLELSEMSERVNVIDFRCSIEPERVRRN